MEASEPKKPLDRALALVETALHEVETGTIALSATIRKCMRIARLRNDYSNLWWLQLEMLSGNQLGDAAAHQEVAARFSKFEYLRLKRANVELYLQERTGYADVTRSAAGEEQALAVSVEELEEHISQLASTISAAIPPTGLDSAALERLDNQCAAVRSTLTPVLLGRKQILSRVRQRVHDFLSQTERELVYGQLNSDFFERNRQYVDMKLQKLAPEAFEKFNSAARLVHDDDHEARALALTSCRRVLKALADAVYPACADPVVGPDGKARDLSEDRYVARLWQFVAERLGKSTSARLLHSTIDDLGSRIDRIYALSCKGVHAEVSQFEANQCTIQTYLLLGDIMRLSEADSGAEQP